ncbi:MAG: sulfite exporter TauE/SafE family protein [Actinomycetota bacterium]|nr:sulfite exporter TauE/SafE family protein [Actinomycetota bacterium]
MSTAPTGSTTLATGPLVLIGILAGLLGGMFGVGGGLLIVPGLVFFGFQQRLAHGTSLAATLLIAIGSFASYLFNDNIDWPMSPALAAGGIIGALLGTKLLHSLHNRVLAYGFAGVLLITAIRLFFDTDANGRAELTMAAIAGLFAIGVVTGVVAGLFGVGGGIVMVPAMVVLFGVPPAIAKGTSVTVILPTALSGTVNNHRRGNLDHRAALVVGGCGLVTGVAGGAIADVMSPTLSNVLFGTLLVVVAARQIRSATTRSPTESAPPAQVYSEGSTA